MTAPKSVPHVLETMTEAGDGETVTLREIVEAFGQQSYGAALTVPAIIAIGPTGAIPGMSMITGGLLAVIGAQMIVGRRSPWMPKRLSEISINRDRLDKLQAQVLPYAKWINRFVSARLPVFTRGPALIAAGVIVIAMALTMFPLALLPFAVAAPAFVVLLVGLGLLVSDGLLIAAGLLLSAAVLYLSGSQLL